MLSTPGIRDFQGGEITGDILFDNIIQRDHLIDQAFTIRVDDDDFPLESRDQFIHAERGFTTYLVRRIHRSDCIEESYF